MFKIAFFIPNKGFCSRDLSNVEKGNPGIGGSEFSAILIASNLSKDKNYNITLLCEEKGTFPPKLKVKACGGLEQSLKYAEKETYDYFVLDAKFFYKELLIRFYNVKFVAWANCFIEPYKYRLFAQYDNIIKVVNVGYHQHELLKKTIVGEKSTYIYNAVPSAFLKNITILPIKKRKHNVIYIGSLHKAKGFHLLAKAWPKILEQVPDAQLYVVGSGHLYGENTKLGKWQIAQESYECEFMPYLTNKEKILPSVHFMGIMGEEKYQLLNECKVGVPNPSGVSETFGYTAVEMELMGCIVTTVSCPGYLDTVFDKRNLYIKTDELAYKVIELLNAETIEYDEVLSFVSKFSVDEIIKTWESFFASLKKNTYSCFFRPKFKEMVKAWVGIEMRILKNLIKSLFKR